MLHAHVVCVGITDAEESDDSDIELNANTITRDFWVKKDVDNDDDAFDKEEDKEEAAARKERRRKEREEAKKQKLEEEAKKQKEKGLAKDADYTPEMIVKKLGELLSKFGRRGTDKDAMIDDLRFLATKAKDPSAFLKVSTALAAALFDSGLGVGDFMPISLWKACAVTVNDIVEMLASNTTVRLSEDDKVEDTLLDEPDPEDELVADLPEEKSSDAKATSGDGKGSNAAPAGGDGTAADGEKDDRIQYVTGNLFPFINRLVGEYRKSLQFTDPHTAVRFSFRHTELTLVESLHSVVSKFEVFIAALSLLLIHFTGVHHTVEGRA